MIRIQRASADALFDLRELLLHLEPLTVHLGRVGDEGKSARIGLLDDPQDLRKTIDISVVTFAVIVFKDIEVALYSAIAIFIVSKIVDAIAQGVDYAKVIYTVTEHGDEVSRAVTERADT